MLLSEMHAQFLREESWLRSATQAGRGSAPVPAFALSLRRPPAARPNTLAGIAPHSPGGFAPPDPAGASGPLCWPFGPVPICYGGSASKPPLLSGAGPRSGGLKGILLSLRVAEFQNWNVREPGERGIASSTSEFRCTGDSISLEGTRTGSVSTSWNATGTGLEYASISCSTT
jgi:hypothetical protein